MVVQNLNDYFKEYISDRNLPSHRYNSFDYCYNYFASFEDKTKIANDINMETSCLQLGFYLASWGMLRGSSRLIDNDLSVFVPIIKTIANCEQEIWDIDVKDYCHEKIREKLIKTYSKFVDEHFNHQRTITLVTKIMLGVFGNVPAFDNNFIAGIKALISNKNIKDIRESRCGFTVFNENSLNAIYNFYSQNQLIINSLSEKTETNIFPYSKSRQNKKFTQAKVIDAIGFQCGIYCRRNNQ